MKHQLLEHGDKTVVELSGSIDFSCNEEFETMLETIKGKNPKQVVFDLKGVSSMDSVGLGLLYIAREEFDGVCSRFALRGANGAPARLLALTRARMAFAFDDV